MMYATRSQTGPTRSRSRCAIGIGERLGLAHMDWPLTIATLGLAAFSVFMLGQATTHDVPGSPGYLRRPADCSIPSSG